MWVAPFPRLEVLNSTRGRSELREVNQGQTFTPFILLTMTAMLLVLALMPCTTGLLPGIVIKGRIFLQVAFHQDILSQPQNPNWNILTSEHILLQDLIFLNVLT